MKIGPIKLQALAPPAAKALFQHPGKGKNKEEKGAGGIKEISCLWLTYSTPIPYP